MANRYMHVDRFHVSKQIYVGEPDDNKSRLFLLAKEGHLSQDPFLFAFFDMLLHPAFFPEYLARQQPHLLLCVTYEFLLKKTRR